jgi:hypothetical protein
MPDLRLVQLIDSVAEGADVNWDDVTAAARSDHERHLIDDLHTVADIAQVHRVFASAPDEDTIPPPDLSSSKSSSGSGAAASVTSTWPVTGG